LNEGRII